MGTQFVGTSSLSMPDRRVLLKSPLEKDRRSVISDSTNVDASGPRTTMLRPGTILLADANGEIWYDDATSGVQSAPATLDSAEAPDADWQNATISLYIDGTLIRTVTLGAGDDTIAEVVTALNADEEFSAWAVAADSGAADLVRITLRVHGKSMRVTSSLATAFGASGTMANPTDADVCVTLEYCDQLDTFGNTRDARVEAVKAGVFDESNLLWAGAAATSAELYQDFKRILKERGSRFE